MTSLTGGLALALAATVGLAAPSIAAHGNGATDSGQTPVSSTCPDVPRAGGGEWTCTFDDEFDGTSLDPSHWQVLTTAQGGFHGGPECLVDSPQTIRVRSGELHLTTQSTRKPVVCNTPWGSYTTSYISGAVTSKGVFSQAYGRFEIRARFPDLATAGLYDGLWLYPESPAYGAWPASGEIDLAEHYSAWPRWVNYNLHYAGEDQDTTRTPRPTCRISSPADFHDYVLEWSSDQISMIYDGQTCWSTAWTPAAPLVSPQPFDQPFFMILNQAVGTGANAPTSASALPATMDVDYVRVWK
ncbi:glycoside hydrolase family 16 protein [Nocardioides terrisoli]|uniref:glycoside hydrolase family 16 protein n=1 Tax=Nocardioides terrisoli TaxID=3388267 RepID=UPI00287B95C6|nr:glycoside hydrolase family 16 protein [Nocardioides marmorisolisilvae]